MRGHATGIATVVLGAAGLLGIPLAGTALAAYTGTATGCTGGPPPQTCTAATLTGDAGSDSLFVVSASGGRMEHNDSINGSAPTFNTGFDFDTTQAGDQFLSNVTGSTLTITAGDGVDGFNLNPASGQIQVGISFNGGPPAGPNPIQLLGTSSPHTVTLTGNTVSGLYGSPFTVTAGSVGDLAIFGSSANDSFHVTNTLSENQVELYGEGGDDTFTVDDGAAIGTFGKFQGSPGTDTLDYSNRSTPVTVDLAQSAEFVADLDSANTVPSTSRHVETTASLFFPDLTTNAFDLSIGIPFDADASANVPAAGISGSGIFTGGPGATGVKLFDTGPASTWSDPISPSDDLTGATDPDVTEQALRDGNTYFELEDAGGQPLTRGQLNLNPESGYFGGASAANSSHGTVTDENVIGGSAGDTVTGSPIANRLDGRGGGDTIHGMDGNDELIGGTGLDDLFGEAGNDILRANDGADDGSVDCGPGTDFAIVDAIDSHVSGCENVGVGKLPTPSSLSTVPASPANDTNPHITGNALPGTTVDVFTTPDCSGGGVGSGTATGAGTFAVPVTVADGSTTNLYIAASGADPTSNCSNPVTYEEIAAAHTPTLSGTDPAGPANNTSPLVRGSVSTTQGPVTVDVFTDANCSGSPAVNDAPAAELNGAGIQVAVPDGATTEFSAKASNPGGDSACSNSVSYEEIGTAATPTLSGTDPAGPANNTSPRVKGSVSTTQGPVTVDVFTNANCSGSPAVNDAPAAELNGAGIQVAVPDNATTALSARASNPGGDSGCSNSISYTESSASDTTPPTVTIGKHPKKRTKARKATFSFSANEAGATFQCALDKAELTACSSPQKFKHLKRGGHKFALEAIDAAGNVSAPTLFRWRVLRH